MPRSRHIAAAAVTCGLCIALGSVPGVAFAGEGGSSASPAGQESVQELAVPSDETGVAEAQPYDGAPEASVTAQAPGVQSSKDAMSSPSSEAASATPKVVASAGEAGAAQSQAASPEPEAPSSNPADQSAGEVSDGRPNDSSESIPQAQDMHVVYQAHVQNVGWQGEQSDGATAGTVGQALRVEALRVHLVSDGQAVSGGIQYQAHVENVGWQDWKSDGDLAGTTGWSLRVEALRFKLDDALADKYDVCYRVHVADYGWLGWTKDGATSGTTGLCKRIEAVQIRLVLKGDASAPSTDGVAYVGPTSVTYQAMARGQGWQQARADGADAGTTGQGLPIDELRLALAGKAGDAAGGISYQVHVSNTGWESAAADSREVGAATANRGIEAVRISLTGDIARYFDVWYQAHESNIGWLGWTKDGQDAGSVGFAQHIEALRVRLVPKGGAAPGSVATPCYTDAAFGGYQPRLRANAMQSHVRSAALSTPSTPPGYCADWITRVFQRAGLGTYHGNACDMYDWYCHSSNPSDLKVGMAIAVRSHGKSAAGRRWGHIGIYIGDGQMLDSAYGRVRHFAVNDWIAYYGDLVHPRWGWVGNVRLA